MIASILVNTTQFYLIFLNYNTFKRALTKFYASKGKSPIFFERNYKSSHLQIQVIPVKSGIKDILKPIFLVCIYHKLILIYKIHFINF